MSEESHDQSKEMVGGILSPEEKARLEEVRKSRKKEFVSAGRQLFVSIGSRLLTASYDIATKRRLAAGVESPSMDQLVNAALQLMPEGAREAESLRRTAAEGLTYAEQQVGETQDEQGLADWKIAKFPIRNNLFSIFTQTDPHNIGFHQNEPNDENVKRALAITGEIGKMMGFITKENPRLPIGGYRRHTTEPISMRIRKIAQGKEAVPGKAACVIDIIYTPSQPTSTITSV